MTSLKSTKEKFNFKNTIIGHLDVNSLKNKFVFAQDLIRDFDIFLISESKLDDTFPNDQFKIDHYKIFRFDRNRYGGGLVLVPVSYWTSAL